MKIKEIRHIDNFESFYEIHWLITRRCSFSCSYCPPHRHDPESFQPKIESLIQALNKFETIVRNNNIRLNLTGGEPTMHPDFIEFTAAAIRNKKVKALRIVTNLSCSEKTYEYLADESNLSDVKFCLVASFHSESAILGRFINNLKVLVNSKVEVLVKIIPHEKGADSISRLLHEIRELESTKINLTVAVQRIRNFRNIEINVKYFETKYTEQLKRWGDLREVLFENEHEKLIVERVSDFDLIIKNNLNSFFKWRCYTGANTLFIDNDGRIFSALCKPDTTTIGNIFDTKLVNIPQSVICPHMFCECGSTVRIPKRLNDENLYC